MARLSAADVHSALAGRWPTVLATLGIDETHLRNRHGPCPACGGKDRFRFDDKHQRGDWICSQCGAGDGFKLLQSVHGWGFREALESVADVAGLTLNAPQPRPVARVIRPPVAPNVAGLTARVRDLLRQATTPDCIPDCVEYLTSRKLWPLEGKLLAHVGVDYYRPLGTGKAIEHLGRFPALVGRVQDRDGETVTAHVTYLRNGQKVADVAPRKILSPVTGRVGCAVRLFDLDGDTLGVGEGIESCLAAAKIHGIPVWACLNTSLLAKFIPPADVRRVIVFADADVAGMKAAWELRDELDGRCWVELQVPKRGDWNDQL